MKKLIAICLLTVLTLVSGGCGGSTPAPSAPNAGSQPAQEPSAPPPPAEAPSFAPPASAEYEPETTDGDFIPNSDEEYLAVNENNAADTQSNPLLTFSLKVDTASYRNVVRYIESGNSPPADAVRIEEMINYFSYEQQLPQNDTPFSVYTEIGPSPFSADKKLAFVRVKSKDIDREGLPSSNLTFLIDVSGSMDSYDKLPLLKSAFGLLVETLGESDTVSIVTYASNSGIALDSARGNEKQKIMDVINGLNAGGSTAGAGGIQAAYKLAEKNFIDGGNNRVILATDGDFNVGVSSVGELEELITRKRDTGVYLSVLGVGTENIKDNKMETLSKYGNGNYSYLDSASTAKKVLVDELTTNMFVIADDVKAQIEFNPTLVSDYRLIGYENRRLNNRDFADDTKDAGEIGIGTDVVLMFELTLAGEHGASLKYGGDAQAQDMGEYGDEFFEVRLRYKDPGTSVSKLITVPVKTDSLLDTNTSDYNFASSVAAFGHLLRGSQYTGDITLTKIIEVSEGNLGADNGSMRKEFVQILKKYRDI